MNNAPPLAARLSRAAFPSSPLRSALDPRPFVVQIRSAGRPAELTILAKTSCDAIVRAIDLFFGDEDVVPSEGLSISAHPVASLTRAA